MSLNRWRSRSIVCWMRTLHVLALVVVVRQVLGEAAGADEGVVHPQAGDQLEEVEDQLALAEAERHRGQRAELECPGGQADQVRADPVELHQDDADDRGPVRDVVGDPEQLLDRQAVGGLVEEAGQVVHAGDERRALGPAAVLEVLLDAGVQVADAAAGLLHALALELEDQPQDAVGGRVLRAHVDHDALVGHARVEGDAVPVAAGDGEDPALGGVVAGGVVGAGVGGRLEHLAGLIGGAHQLYDLRWSGAGMVAPLYSTGIPPSG